MHMHRSYIDDGQGGQLHVVEAGSGPAILLLHQTPRSADEFFEVMQLLSHKYRLVAMDLPGMGASSACPDSASIELYADAACRVADWMDETSICVCGHHTGGAVAIEVAARRPNWLGSLVLSSTPWIDEQARLTRAGRKSIDSVEHNIDGSHLGEYWHQRQPYYPDSVDILDRFMRDALRSHDASEGHRAVSAFHMETRAPEILCDLLIVEHSKDPFASKHTHDLTANFPKAKLKKIDDGMVALEITADHFAALLDEWVAE